MRTLSEIIESAKDGNMPTHEECYWAMLAVNAVAFLDHRALNELANRPSKLLSPKFQWEESFRRWKSALNRDPKSYVGWNNDPSNSDYQKMRSASLRLMNKIMDNQSKKPDRK